MICRMLVALSFPINQTKLRDCNPLFNHNAEVTESPRLRTLPRNQMERPMSFKRGMKGVKGKK